MTTQTETDLEKRIQELELQMSRKKRSEEDRLSHPRVTQAAAWLHSVLVTGPAYANAIKSAAEESGVKWSVVKDAATRLRVIKEKEGFGGPWVWRLPPHAGV